MRVLVLTKLFPNSLEPNSAPFNRQQFGALSRLCDVEILATIPWFPGASAFGRWSSAGRLGEVPAEETIDGMRVRHPRFTYVPKMGTGLTGPLYAASLARTVLAYRGRADVLLGSWAYPDGYAAVVLAGLLGVPAVVKIHGSDLNVLANQPGARRRMQRTLPKAARVIAVSRPLGDIAAKLGVPRERIDVVPNGIDRERFRPQDRAEARQKLGLTTTAPIVLYVGHIAKAKGALDLVQAFALAGSALRGARLLMLGDGAELETCTKLCETLRVDAQLLGPQPHDQIPLWLAACDILALPSWNEGIPNVVLEALACGRRVVCTDVGGIPDIVTSRDLGLLVPPRQHERLAAALIEALAMPADPEGISRALPVPSWAGSAALVHRSLLSALAEQAKKAVIHAGPTTEAITE